MKPTRSGIVVESTITGHSTEMTIDVDAMAHIMAVLTDLYSDPEYAVIREYATNAIDSHVEAGNDAPIEVSLPSPLSLFLRIRDNGIGLTRKDIEAMYSRYGASTKRGTNEQTGMLGLGSKSALTYAQQFTIIGRKNGKKISVAVSRNEGGGGTMTVVNEDDTDEPNGVEIVIPVQRENTLEEKANKLFKYWPAGMVLVNGKQPASFRQNALKITDSIFLVEDQENHNSYYHRSYYYDDTDDDSHVCVMGNVPYPMRLPKDFRLPYGTKLVAYVPIGAVNFTPSREALHYTNHTNKAITKIIADYKSGMNGAIQREVDQAASHSDALAVVARWQKYLDKGSVVTFTYKKDTLPSEYTETGKDGTAKSLRVTAREQYGRLSGYSSQKGVSASEWPKTAWVENFVPSDCSADHKRKLNKWADDSGLSHVKQYVLLTGKVKRNKFMADAQIVDYVDTIRPIKLKENAAPNYGTARLKGSYDVITEADKQTRNGYSWWEAKQVLGSDIRQDELIVYERGNAWTGRNLAQDLAALYPKFTLVTMPKGRLAKFKRDVPDALTFDEAVKAKYDEWEATLTDDQRTALAIHDAGATDDLRWLDPDRISDPDLTEAIRIAKVKVTKLVEQRTVFSSLAKRHEKWENPLRKYPLVYRRTGYYSGGKYGLNRDHKDHVYLYINCVFNNTKKGTP